MRYRKNANPSWTEELLRAQFEESKVRTFENVEFVSEILGAFQELSNQMTVYSDDVTELLYKFKEYASYTKWIMKQVCKTLVWIVF